MMNQGLNPLELVLNASIIVQIVMALLLLASIVSWSIMLRKRAELRRARIDADRFEEVFWSGGDLTAMFRAIDQGRRVTKGMEAIFESGFREFQRMRQQGGFPSAQFRAFAQHDRPRDDRRQQQQRHDDLHDDAGVEHQLQRIQALVHSRISCIDLLPQPLRQRPRAIALRIEARGAHAPIEQQVCTDGVTVDLLI